MTENIHNWYFALTHTLERLIRNVFVGPGRIARDWSWWKQWATPLQPAAIPISRFRPVSIHILRRERPAHNKHSSITVTPHFVIATQPCGRLLQISISHRPVPIVYERARASFAHVTSCAPGTKHRLPAITPAIIFPPLTARSLDGWVAASAQSKRRVRLHLIGTNGAEAGAAN
jgi:hypothetical protein